jgi:PEP-CTERM motif
MCRSRLSRLAWIFALTSLASLRVLRADTVAYFTTGTVQPSATFQLHSDGVPAFATITGFSSSSNPFPQYIFSTGTLNLPPGTKINSVTLNYAFTPDQYFSVHNIYATGPCFYGDLSGPCSPIIPPPTFNDVNLAISPTITIETAGADSEFETVSNDSLSGSLLLSSASPNTDWEGFLKGLDYLSLNFGLTLLPPTDPGSLINNPGQYQHEDVAYLAALKLKDSLSLTIDYTTPEVPPPPVPEPDTIWLMASGLISIGALVRKRSQRHNVLG